MFIVKIGSVSAESKTTCNVVLTMNSQSAFRACVGFSSSLCVYLHLWIKSSLKVRRHRICTLCFEQQIALVRCAEKAFHY